MPEEVTATAASDVGTHSHGVTPESQQNAQAQEPSQEFGESVPKGATDTSEEKPKGKRRYDRTREWRQGLEEREARLAQREAQYKSPYALARERRIANDQREAQLAARERALAEREAPSQKPKYTLAELRECREQWAREAEYDDSKAELVAKADAKIAELEARARQEAGSRAFREQWEQAEAALAKEDPDFGRGKGTPLDRLIQEILASPAGEHYRTYPLGIIAVYDAAKKILLEEENNGLRTRVSKFETENKRLSGLTSIGGGSPGQFSGNGGSSYTPEQFAKLSAKQMKDHLLRDARR